MSEKRFNTELLNVKHIPCWIAFFIWWLTVQILPYRAQMRVGDLIGSVAKKVAKRRTHIAKKNIELCFPDKTQQEQQDLLERSMSSLGKGFMESGMAWFWPARRLRGLYTISGKEHIDKAKQQDQGVLFLGIHFTPIEICAAFINQTFAIDGFYRPHKNAIYEYVQCHGRTRHNRESEVIPRNDVRKIVKALRAKHIINYAPDQDYGLDHSVFAPFFGIPTATVTAPSKLARLGNAKIIPYTTRRRTDDKGYDIVIFPPLDGLGSGNEVADATIINQFIEARIKENPEQYLWVHRRFKTRPNGDHDFYNTKKNNRIWSHNTSVKSPRRSTKPRIVN